MEGLLCDLLWADPSDDPGVTNIEALSDQVYWHVIFTLYGILPCIMPCIMPCVGVLMC